MNPTLFCTGIIAILATCVHSIVPGQRIATVTNEDIRDAILQVVNVVRATDDKLERHEYRERVLGEVLKKGMLSIDKRIKLLEPFKGTVSRLDQRLAAVETILMQRDERERLQLQKTQQTVEDIHQNLPTIVEKLKSEILTKLAEKNADNIPKSAIDDIAKGFEQIGGAMKAIERNLEAKIGENGARVADLGNKTKFELNRIEKRLNSSGDLLENKLEELNNRVPNSPPPNPAILANILQALELQKSQSERILSNVQGVDAHVAKLANKTDLAAVENATRANIARKNAELVGLLENQMRMQVEDGETKQNQTLDSVLDVKKAISGLNDMFSTNYGEIKAQVENLGKVEQVMVQTADSVLDNKRRVEYGVHQVINELQTLAKKSSKDVNEAISERFDTFEMSILDEENGALANITSKIGQEIDQVWRQIGIMHQQMSASTVTLNKLQNQTDAYVNGSTNVMDNMNGKVGTITGRMSELDDNLNFFMGKLGLISANFNQLKAELGTVLGEMKETYQAVKDTIDDGKNGGAPDAANSTLIS